MTTLWPLQLIYVMFSTLGTISNLTIMHCVLQKPHIHGLIVKFIALSTFPSSQHLLLLSTEMDFSKMFSTVFLPYLPYLFLLRTWE